MARLRLRSDLALTLVCMALYVGAAAQVRSGEHTSLGVATAVVTRPIINTANWAAWLWHDFSAGRRDLREALGELGRLRAEAAELRRVNQLLASEVAELRQGSRLLARFPELHRDAILARVVSRDVLSTNTIRLDRGKEDGIRVDAAVLAERGVLGRVDLVTAHGCRVQLLSHPAAAAAARIVGVESEALLVGGERPKLTNLPPYTDVETSLPVITTGSEGIYPPGLLLGTTQNAAIEGLFTAVSVLLAVRPGEVAVVLVIPPPEGAS